MKEKHMETKNKLLTVLVCFLILVLLAGAGAFKPKQASGNIGSAADDGSSGQTARKIKKLGGVECRMPENSALVFFGSTFGLKLTSYKAYKNFDEALFSLKSKETDAVWACDVSTDYLLKVNDGLRKADDELTSDIQRTDAPRFSFGMALKKDSGEKLRDEINEALAGIKADGTLDGIISKYVDKAEYYETETGKKERFYPENMKNRSGNGTIKVGITGAVPPLELLDENMEPYGFCVALMDEIAARTGKKVRFVYIDNETAFTSLVSGRVDLLFAYGNSPTTTESKLVHIMTDGYLDMQRYYMIQLGE